MYQLKNVLHQLKKEKTKLKDSNYYVIKTITTKISSDTGELKM